MKALLKRSLQRLLGFRRYLLLFALFKIRTFRWDNNEKDFFQFLDMLQPDHNVLDIGSNIGVTTVHLSRRVKRGVVHSFEPLPPNFETLQRVVAHHRCPNVKLYNLAIGDHDGEVDMVLPEVDDVQMQGLSHVVHEDLPDFNEGKQFRVALRYLDTLDVLQGQTIHGIKLDVENFEYFVFKGAQKLLRRDRPIIYTELWDNENRQRCFDLITTLGYTIYVYHHNQLVPYQSARHTTQNFFFLPQNTQA